MSKPLPVGDNVDFIYEHIGNASAPCKDCGMLLRDCNGVVDSKGNYFCRETFKCQMRVARKNLSVQAEQGIKPRWRS